MIIPILVGLLSNFVRSVFEFAFILDLLRLTRMLTVGLNVLAAALSPFIVIEISGTPVHCFRCLDRRSNERSTESHTVEALDKQLLIASNDREFHQLETNSVSGSTGSDAIAVGVPIIGAAVVIAVFLGIIKLCYLKQRRIKTIHEIPVSLEAALLEEDKSSELSTPTPPGRPLSVTADATSARSHRASQRSSFFSRSSQRSHSRSRSHSRRSSALTGILVGMLGSPDWETDMQRRLADHVWRERVASRSAGASSQQHRHSWHAAASLSTDESRRNSRFSARSGGSRVEARSRRAYSARIPHISSFGEIGLMPIARRRPNSHNGVCDPNRADISNQNPAFLSPDLHQDSRNYNVDARAQASNNQSPQYPMLREVSSPSTSTVTDYGTAPTSLRIHITDYSDDALTRPQSAHIVNPGSENSTPASSPFIGQSASGGSSATSSWGQLPNFPSPPLTPASPALASPITPYTSNFVTINNVLVAPYAIDEAIYSANAGLFLGKAEKGLGLILEREEDFSKHYSKEARESHSSLLANVGWPYTAFSSSLSLPLPGADEEATDSCPEHLEEVKEPAVNMWDKPLKARHLKVLTQIPTALVAPPKAYLQPLRLPDDLTVDTTAGNSFMTLGGDTSPSPISTFVPVRPSPLRKLASLESISLSSKSVHHAGKNVDGLGQTGSPSNPQPPQHSLAVYDSKLRGYCDITAPPSASARHGANLVRKDSRASDFLDLSCSAAGESTDFFSFDSSSYGT